MTNRLEMTPVEEFERGLTLFSTYVLKLGRAGFDHPANTHDAIMEVVKTYVTELSVEDAKMLAGFLPVIMETPWEVLGLRLMTKLLLEGQE